MLPVRWMYYEILPKNDNGKIDRPRLKNAFLLAESRDAKTEAC
jgi:acyl-coenzyme A synthetase/AMP-(fatty) acid ligase